MYIQCLDISESIKRQIQALQAVLSMAGVSKSSILISILLLEGLSRGEKAKMSQELVYEKRAGKFRESRKAACLYVPGPPSPCVHVRVCEWWPAKISTP